jgi:hypothetical protein
MRKLVIRLPLLAVSVWMGWSPSVRAMDVRYTETVYLAPTILSVPTVYIPTSSVVTSSYLVPSALTVPSYYATAYVADEVVIAPVTTTYVETRYRPGLLGRLLGRDRVVERSFVSSYPTAYVPTVFSSAAYYPSSYSVVRDYTPTVFDYRVPYETAYVTSPAFACDEVVSSWKVVNKEAPPVKAPGAAANSGAKQVESRVADEETIPSNVDAAPGAYTALPPPAPIEDASKAKSTTGSEADSPPAPPVPEKEKKAAPTGAGAAKNATNKAAAPSSPATKPAAPKVPAGEKNDSPPIESAPSGETRHDSQKPAVYPLSAVRPERRNILFGKVESSAAGQPEEEVRVIVASRSNRAIRHEGMTDAYGRFAIKLTDGDWTVNVTMPKGSVYPVSQITVASGRIFDATDGREVPSLIITR